MPYVLVCLVGDDNTRLIERSAREFERGFHASEILTPLPPFHEVTRAVAEGDALVTGHNGGGSLRDTSQGSGWANAAQFSAMFRGARVYVYACETLGSKGAESLSSFGHEAMRGGVRCFAGHCVVVPTDNLASGIDPVLHAMWGAFLRGEDDQDMIKQVAWRAFGATRKHVRGGALGFAQLSSALSATIHALRVLTAPTSVSP